MAIHINTTEQFDEILESNRDKLIIVDFYATWCGPCRVVGPQFEDMASKMNNIVCLKVDVDQHEELVERYDISAMPTFIYIKNKEKVDVISGANFEKIQEKVKQYS
ncbi:unnamed protein product [Gordionus sp. m RMFG-2023]|uniref:thioredoxin-1-like n=1 Tax=Gordionus sp. m RMFG-2023 TaxID=3053472 RepID=UPI0030E1CF92